MKEAKKFLQRQMKSIALAKAKVKLKGFYHAENKHRWGHNLI
jgi:hypothetical protein